MGMINKDGNEKKKRDFVFASTAVAKQMMETLQDAATNAKEVLGYNLPAKFSNLADDSEAKKLIMQGNGNFYSISMKLLEMHEGGSLPVPDPNNLLAAFVDGS